VQRTLLVPLIARAQAGRWCPRLNPQDRFAADALTRTGENTDDCPLDFAVAINILWRTHRIRDIGLQFFEQHPRAEGVNLGAGLSHYFQWLAREHNRWRDVDLPDVVALRRQLLPAPDKHHRLQANDVRQPGWWQRLGLPERGDRRASPLLLVCEGLLMYMQPGEVQALVQEIGQHAPAGTELVCDFISPLGVGHALVTHQHPHEATTFTWGTHHAQDIADLHPRLQLLAEHSVAEAYGWCGQWLEQLSGPLTGGPMYALAHLRVRPTD
jgi:O-methyltransferase involved in polyketide biosynthesis